MAIAETASLLADLRLKDGLTPGVATAVGSVDRLESRLGSLTGKLGSFASHIRGGVSGALSTFTGRLQGAARAGLGLLGIGGLLSAASIFKNSIDGARQFGDASIQMARATGLSIDKASRLVDTLDYFGVAAEAATRVAGMYEKNIGNLTSTAKKAADFQDTFGLSIFDSKGKVRDFNDQLLVSADFFNNKTIPASQKAAALAKLYGRNWQDLLPILAQGRKGIEDANRKSMSLSEADLAAITKNKEATRAWNDAIGDLQVKIGIGLLPTITEVVTTMTGWIDSHGQEIQDFFKNGVTTIRGLVSSAISVVGGIKSAWDGIPEPLRDLLLKGFVADRTLKFLFGFSITGIAKDLVGGVAGGLGNALVRAGIGKAFVQPVFVTNPAFAGGGGGGGAVVPGGKGGLGILGALGLGSFILALAFPIGEAIRDVAMANGWSDGRSQTQEIKDRVAAGSKQRGEMEKTSPAERQIQAKLDAIADANERNRIAIQTGARTTTSGGHQDASRIVSALGLLGRLRATVPITINLPGGGTRTYQGATYLSRTGQIGALQGM